MSSDNNGSDGADDKSGIQKLIESKNVFGPNYLQRQIDQPEPDTYPPYEPVHRTVNRTLERCSRDHKGVVGDELKVTFGASAWEDMYVFKAKVNIGYVLSKYLWRDVSLEKRQNQSNMDCYSFIAERTRQGNAEKLNTYVLDRGNPQSGMFDINLRYILWNDETDLTVANVLHVAIGKGRDLDVYRTTALRWQSFVKTMHTVQFVCSEQWTHHYTWDLRNTRCVEAWKTRPNTWSLHKPSSVERLEDIKRKAQSGQMDIDELPEVSGPPTYTAAVDDYNNTLYCPYCFHDERRLVPMEPEIFNKDNALDLWVPDDTRHRQGGSVFDLVDDPSDVENFNEMHRRPFASRNNLPKKPSIADILGDDHKDIGIPSEHAKRSTETNFDPGKAVSYSFENKNAAGGISASNTFLDEANNVWDFNADSDD